MKAEIESKMFIREGYLFLFSETEKHLVVVSHNKIAIA